ncbi:MAG TPA: hypothetical protein VEF72_23510 [Mycobacterium sp.]|nr:hypothetical protein [Mycobacterium sp.]
MPRAAGEDAARVLAGPVRNAITRYGGYGAAAREALVAISAGTINDAALTTKVGFLPGLKAYDQYQTLGSITAKTTVISGGDNRIIPPSHAQDLAAGIPDATLVYRPSAGHMLLHETPRLVTDAISCTIARSSATLRGWVERARYTRPPEGHRLAAVRMSRTLAPCTIGVRDQLPAIPRGLQPKEVV